MDDLDKEQLWPVFVGFFSKAMSDLDIGEKTLFDAISIDNNSLKNAEIVDLARQHARLGDYDMVRHVGLIAFLRITKNISARDAAELLTKFERDGSNSKIKELSRVFDVLALVNEDMKDGYLTADDDVILDQALEGYLYR